ncbi:hypothetical protein DAPPUDRAFT_272728 [Daphnia pulex]|uniref:Uncharacterized protein n=1 Tax=Daphnia pulex TaxID=6669 RepID=E9I355_DAPPU|nr:hypothetical protein DAPPUDRAFT_272728 [Daphnia pulex]|eukprot:EFX61575.1 hypothetical protein DAPPUDRAFT_272728 [Daphnia pulex]
MASKAHTFNAHSNFLASSDSISGLEGLMTIIYAFDHVLTERGFGVNVGHLTFNAHSNFLASSDFISGLEGLMTIIYAFDHVLTERGFGVNVGHLLFHSGSL